MVVKRAYGMGKFFLPLLACLLSPSIDGLHPTSSQSQIAFLSARRGRAARTPPTMAAVRVSAEKPLGLVLEENAPGAASGV
jgi:hypothetical protein